MCRVVSFRSVQCRSTARRRLERRLRPEPPSAASGAQHDPRRIWRCTVVKRFASGLASAFDITNGPEARVTNLLGPADTCRFGSSAATVVAVAEPAGLEEVAPGDDRKQKGGSGHLVDEDPELGDRLRGVVGIDDCASGEERCGDLGRPVQAREDCGDA